MRVGVIGHFGGHEVFNDGQTVKTVTVYNALKNYGFDHVDKIDTYYIKRNPVQFCISFLKAIFYDQKFIVLLSSNGRKILFPVLYVLSQFGKDIYHYGIGGRLAREVTERPKWKKYVSAFRGNWMESILLANQLQTLGVQNAIYLPNFKKLNILKPENLTLNYVVPFKFCIFSRVMAEKGVEDAINAIVSVNAEHGSELAQLDIYGPIEHGYEERFNKCLDIAGPSCKYCGIVESTESVETLKNYFMLLFPTCWRHEGIPGTIIDALSAGVPVISRQWQYCLEMLEHGKTGYIYDFDRPEELPEVIKYAIDHSDDVVHMKANCLKAAYQYSEQHVMKQIIDEMGLNFQ